MIQKEDIQKLALLARIKISEEEEADLLRDIDAILTYVADIERALPKEVKGTPELRNVMREDAESHEAGIFTEDLLEAAPSKEENYVRVKKIIDR